jgi:DNA-binding transcriptional LysR family regulator
MTRHDLQLDWLRTFVAVVDAGSLAAAAPALHRSPSAVSMGLRKLEDAVGRPVLSRGPRHLSLTAAGHELLVHARRLRAAHTEALDALHGSALSGALRIGVPDDYAVAHLGPVLRAFGPRHPAVEIQLSCAQSTALLPQIARGELDLAIVSCAASRGAQPLFEEPMVWVGAADFDCWRRDPLPVAAYEAGSLARRAALAALSQARRRHRVVCNTPSLAGQLAAVESGLAVAALTRCSVPSHLLVLGERQGLPPMAPMQVAVVRSKASRGSVAVDAFHAMVLQTMPRDRSLTPRPGA